MRGKLLNLLPQGRIRKLAINLASLFSMQVANMLLPLLTVPYVSRIIGPERLGLLSLSLVYNGYFVMLIDFGFNLSVVRLIAVNRSDKVYVNRVFNEIIVAKLCLLGVAGLLFVSAAVVSPAFREHLPLHLFTCSYCIGAVLFPQWLYQGMEDLDKLAVFSLVSRLLMVAGILLLIRQPDDYVYQNLLTGVVHIGVGTFALRTAIRRYALRFMLPTWSALRDRFREASAIFMSTVASTLYNSSHVFLLGTLSTAYAVGVFAAAGRLETIVRAFVSIVLNQALLPVIAAGFGQSREQGLAMVRRVAPLMILLTSLVSIGLGVGAPLVVNLLYGSQFTDVVVVLRILACLPLLIAINSLLGLYTMLNLRMDKAYFGITSTGAILGVGLNTIMIQQSGYVGAAIAWVVTEFCIVIGMLLWLRHKKIFILTTSGIIYDSQLVIGSNNKS